MASHFQLLPFWAYLKKMHLRIGNISSVWCSSYCELVGFYGGMLLPSIEIDMMDHEEIFM